MELNQNVINYGILALMIIIIIHILFNKNKIEKLNTKIINSHPNKQKKIKNMYETFDDKIYDFHTGTTHIEKMKECPIGKNNENNKLYVQKKLLGSSEICPNKPQTQKEFHDDFFNFRDLTYRNSSMYKDSVDKIQDLYLSGNLSDARTYPNMKIKNLYDEATRGPNLYERSCVRLPKFDNINPEGWYMNYGTPGMSLTRDNWKYKNEKIMNGGEIVNGIYPAEIDNEKNLDVSVYK